MSAKGAVPLEPQPIVSIASITVWDSADRCSFVSHGRHNKVPTSDALVSSSFLLLLVRHLLLVAMHLFLIASCS